MIILQHACYSLESIQKIDGLLKVNICGHMRSTFMAIKLKEVMKIRCELEFSISLSIVLIECS
jgi:hypothetical protein